MLRPCRTRHRRTTTLATRRTHRIASALRVFANPAIPRGPTDRVFAPRRRVLRVQRDGARQCSRWVGVSPVGRSLTNAPPFPPVRHAEYPARILRRAGSSGVERVSHYVGICEFPVPLHPPRVWYRYWLLTVLHSYHKIPPPQSASHRLTIYRPFVQVAAGALQPNASNATPEHAISQAGTPTQLGGSTPGKFVAGGWKPVTEVAQDGQ